MMQLLDNGDMSFYRAYTIWRNLTKLIVIRPIKCDNAPNVALWVYLGVVVVH